MTNEFVAEKLEKLGHLLEITGENPFKVNAYYKAARSIESLEADVAELAAQNKLNTIEGVGEAIRQKVNDIVTTGTCPKLTELEAEIPEGVVEMLRISGLGPKKIQVIWKEMGITSVGDLLYACNENRLVQQKGFGEKTQEKIRKAIEFLQQNEDFFHYATLRPVADEFLKRISKITGKSALLSLTGEIRRQMPVLRTIELLAAADLGPAIVKWLEESKEYHLVEEAENKIIAGIPQTRIRFEILLTEKNFWLELLRTTGSEAHLQKLGQLPADPSSEAAIYESAGMQFIVPEMREDTGEIELARSGNLPELVSWHHIKGMVHNHSTWSDGIHSLEQMAAACIDLGMEYLCISDHSKSAFYANGLNEERIAAQHREIDELNKKLAPFRIFKGIESDILNDGSLDYPDEVLATFDYVIASVHSQLSMTEEKATARLIRAIENPWCTMLGHPTGRLLLMRKGYPIDHRKVIDACAANGVVIEINANPWRLDLDWQWIPYALSKGVMISVNPDAHKMEGYADTHWGIAAARKGRLTPGMTFNALGRDEVDAHFSKKRGK